MPPTPAVHSIDHFALNVPSLDVAEHFYRSFGLRVERTGGDRQELSLYATDGHRWARILPADRKSLAYLSFNCYAADFDALYARIVAAGADPVTGEDQDGVWFHDPDGNLLQVKVGPKTSPCAKTRNVVAGSAADARGSHTRSESKTVHPDRLSHVLLFTPDVLRAIAFYHDALGLQLSDKSQDIIAFTHAPHGSDHHLVAFAKSGARGWHHAAWDVADVNLVGEGASQMAAAGYDKGWGTGRHVLGSNYFHYVEDPWGSFCEYSADIDFVSAGHPWPAGDFPPEDSLYLWGPPVPGNFVHNTEAPE
ncbi:metapyrocatechase [Burkholderia sp. Ac-20384]|uniref:VOC family protein n=1 Tax=Burkholderia sp. Ac-20384 TaxID=2703902 RepID=UPI00197F0670|nr:VOC family protein [Burkholderia sp. Ac-20384]MBN3822843.1 metapyrocatechase [Burkholderia sp. Ac-20384]